MVLHQLSLDWISELHYSEKRRRERGGRGGGSFGWVLSEPSALPSDFPSWGPASSPGCGCPLTFHSPGGQRCPQGQTRDLHSLTLGSSPPLDQWSFICGMFSIHRSHTLDLVLIITDPLLGQCWASVVDGGPTLTQQCVCTIILYIGIKHNDNHDEKQNDKISDYWLIYKKHPRCVSIPYIILKVNI